MDESEEGAGASRTTRREVLKKAAIVGGVAWSLPVIESLTTPAFAGSGSCPVWDCTDPFQSVCNCGGIGGGFVKTFAGGCVCARPVESALDCASCPPGEQCLGPATDCDADTVVCGTPCS